MARFTLGTPGEDGTVGGDVEVFGTTSGDEVITVTGGTIFFDASFNQGGDTIVLPGNSTDYVVTLSGSRIILTSDDGTVVNIPLGTTANTLSFDDGDADLVVVDGEVTVGGEVVEDGDRLGGGTDPGEAVTLTEGTDVVEGGTFNAPRGFTPGGTDQVNTLNDDDELTGTGDNATLNFTFVNDVDSGDMNINPTMTNVRVVNVSARFDGDGTLDLQDSEGVQEINVNGVDDDAVLTLDNIQEIEGGEFDFSITDSNADNGAIRFLFDTDAVEGEGQTVNLGLDDAEVERVVIDDVDTASNVGVEDLNISATGDGSEIGTIAVEDVETITISGDADLSLGTRSDALRGNPNSSQVEAFRYGAAFERVAGSLTSIDASGFEGNLELNIGDEALANLDELSDGPVNLEVIGGSGDDTFRLLGGFDSDEDTIDAGEGDDTLQVFASVADGSIANVELLDIRTGQDDDSAGDLVEIDASLFDDALVAIWIRNEGMQGPNGPNDIYRTGNAEGSEVILNNLNAEQAANISIQHATTGNNSLFLNVVEANLADGDLVGVTIVDKLGDEDRGINTDPRFNFFLDAGAANVTLTDIDSESNTVDLFNSDLTDTLTIEGAGQEGRFLNLDSFGTAQTGIYGIDVTGTADDIGADNDNQGLEADVIQQRGGIPTYIDAENVDSTTYTGDVIIRVGAVGAQNFAFGIGDDTLIFDGVASNTAGLTVTDTANGGAGWDTIAFESDVRVTLGASEWEGVSNFEEILLIGNGVASSDDGDVFENEFGENSYNVRLTNDLLESNGTEEGGVRSIHVRNDNNVAGTQNGVTIDATQLDNDKTFSYDGEEGVAGVRTSDRFILSDANINGNAEIDGGARIGDNGVADHANEDILEVRATSGGLGAQVTIDDLAGISNVSELQFTNFTGSDVDSFLALDNETIERLVNTATAGVVGDEDILTVSVWDNQSGGGETTLELNLDEYTAGNGQLLAFEGDGTLEIDGILDFDAAEAAGLDFDDFTGTVLFVDSGEQVIFGTAGDDTLTGTGAAETIIGGGGNDTISGLGGADDLRGENGRDTINGGNGADRITGGNGGDTLTGGSGADTFVVSHGESVANNNGAFVTYDRITDFDQAGDDVIELVGVAAFGNADVGAGVLQGSEVALVDYLEGQIGNAIFGAFEALIYAEGAAGTGVLIDSNNNDIYDADDVFVWLEDPQAVTGADFTFA